MFATTVLIIESLAHDFDRKLWIDLMHYNRSLPYLKTQKRQEEKDFVWTRILLFGLRHDLVVRSWPSPHGRNVFFLFMRTAKNCPDLGSSWYGGIDVRLYGAGGGQVHPGGRLGGRL